MITYKHDPVCGKKMVDREIYVEIEKEIDGITHKVLLCCPECHEKFEKDEIHYINLAIEMEKQKAHTIR